MAIVVGLKKILDRVEKREFGDKGSAVKEAVEAYSGRLDKINLNNDTEKLLNEAHEQYSADIKKAGLSGEDETMLLKTGDSVNTEQNKLWEEKAARAEERALLQGRGALSWMTKHKSQKIEAMPAGEEKDMLIQRAVKTYEEDLKAGKLKEGMNVFFKERNLKFDHHSGLISGDDPKKVVEGAAIAGYDPVELRASTNSNLVTMAKEASRLGMRSVTLVSLKGGKADPKVERWQTFFEIKKDVIKAAGRHDNIDSLHLKALSQQENRKIFMKMFVKGHGAKDLRQVHRALKGMGEDEQQLAGRLLSEMKKQSKGPKAHVSPRVVKDLEMMDKAMVLGAEAIREKDDTKLQKHVDKMVTTGSEEAVDDFYKECDSKAENAKGDNPAPDAAAAKRVFKALNTDKHEDRFAHLKGDDHEQKKNTNDETPSDPPTQSFC